MDNALIALPTTTHPPSRAKRRFSGPTRKRPEAENRPRNLGKRRIIFGASRPMRRVESRSLRIARHKEVLATGSDHAILAHRLDTPGIAYSRGTRGKRNCGFVGVEVHVGDLFPQILARAVHNQPVAMRGRHRRPLEMHARAPPEPASARKTALTAGCLNSGMATRLRSLIFLRLPPCADRPSS